MNHAMEARRYDWTATVRLATALSVAAALVAVALEAAGDAPRATLVLAVVTVGFVASWVRSGRDARPHGAAHRIAVVPLRRPVA